MKKYTNKILIVTGILIVLFFVIMTLVIVKFEQNFEPYEVYNEADSIENVEDI